MSLSATRHLLRLRAAPHPGFRPPMRLVALAALVLPLAACSIFAAPLSYRGQNVTQDDIKKLVPGTTTEADVTHLLGSPTSRGLFDPNRWSYMSQVTHTRIGRMPGVVQQNVVVLTFNEQGVLQSVQDLGEKNEVAVSMAGGATPSPGGSASFFQQLIGNVGRYSPGALPGQTLGPSQGGLNGGTP